MLGTYGSFSVSGWVSPAGCASGQYCAVLSQGANVVSAFTLGYQRYGTAYGAGGTSVGCPCFLFALAQDDAAGDEYAPGAPDSGWDVAAVQAPAGTLNAWTQLTGVFNASHGQLELYVNGGDVSKNGGQAGGGLPAATAGASAWTVLPAWASAFRVGADWTSGGGAADFFNGAVSDACAFYGVLLPADVQTLYSPALTGHSGTDGCSALYGDHP